MGRLQVKAQDAGCTEGHCGRYPANEACHFYGRRSAGSPRLRLHLAKIDGARSPQWEGRWVLRNEGWCPGKATTK